VELSAEQEQSLLGSLETIGFQMPGL
jgi:hypothetical protein